MKPILLGLAVLFSLFILASCQTLSKEECTSADWRVIGEQDGANGKDPQKRFGDHAKSCEKAGIVANQTLWNQGYQIGLRRFCTPLSGLAHGQKGQAYSNNCPVDLAPNFRIGYDLGVTYYTKSREISNIRSRINSIEFSIKDKEKKISEGKIDQRDAQYRIKDDRRAINELNRDIGRKEAELGAIERDMENFRYNYSNASVAGQVLTPRAGHFQALNFRPVNLLIRFHFFYAFLLLRLMSFCGLASVMKNKSDYLDALVLAIDRQLVKLETSSGETLLLNAIPLPQIDNNLVSSFHCEQGFRPTFNALKEAGYVVEPRLDLTQYSNAIVIAGRVRKVNEMNICRAWNALKEGGTLVLTGDKNTGIQPLRKWVGQRTEITESFSKFHGLVFTAEKSGDAWPVENSDIAFDDYKTTKGMFSADGPDKGSKVLIEHFDNRLRGKVADFGAGWGFLSNEALKVAPRIESVDLYEADYLSIEGAKQNVATQIPTSFNWTDLNTEFKKKPYDWVLMNPPFHAGLSSGRAAEPNLGKRFIEVASTTLISGGRLLMVANRTLPYEEILNHAFKRSTLLADKNGFKVYEAVK